MPLWQTSCAVISSRSRAGVGLSSRPAWGSFACHLAALPGARPYRRSQVIAGARQRPDNLAVAPPPGAAAALPAKQPAFDPHYCRYALDVNINSLDVLNHKRLLDSARSDPSAVSFQLRPVDVVSGSDLAKRPSFGSLDTLQMHHEVRACRPGQR